MPTIAMGRCWKFEKGDARELQEAVHRAEVAEGTGLRPIALRTTVHIGDVIDSALEGSGFEPTVPRKVPVVVLVSVLVRADFSASGESSGGDMSPARNLACVTPVLTVRIQLPPQR
jgi:hypothetical protein